MTTLNEQELQDVTQGTTGPKDAEFNEVTAKRFIGSLTGNASTATQLQNNFSVVFNGDVEGRLSDCNGAGGYVVNIKVKESNHAKSAEFTAKTNYSDHAHFADLANLATHSLTTDLAHNSEHSNESEHALNSDNSLHAVQADTDNKQRNIADTFDSILYTDLPTIRTDITNITPTAHTVNFKDKEYKLKNTLLADENNENKLLQDFSNGIQDVDNRVTNLEITTDLGKVTERIVKIEELNEQQDTRLDSIDTLNTEQNTRLDSIDTLNTEQNTRLDSIDTLNTKQNTRLDNVESLANSTATTVTKNKNAVDTQINDLKQEDTALSNRITNLDTTHTQDIERLGNSDTSLQEQITLQAQSFNSHKEDESAHGNLLHYTDSNAHSELFAQCVKSVNGVNADADGNIEIQAGGSFPDYSAGVSVSLVNSQLNFTASTDGYFILSGLLGTLYINGLKVGFMAAYTGWDGCVSTIILNKGDVVTTSGVVSNYQGTFFPCKGAN